MSSGLCIRELQEFALLCLEHPSPAPLWLPIPTRDPPIPFVGMSASAPMPCHFPDVGIPYLECPCGNNVAVIICPASNYQVEGFDKDILCPSMRLLHCSPDLVGDRFNRLPRWLDEQFFIIFPYVVS